MKFISKKSVEQWARREMRVIGAARYFIKPTYIFNADKTRDLAYVVSFRFE